MTTIPSVRVFTPEILWHDKFSPILSIDYEPINQSTNPLSSQPTNQSENESIRRIVTSGVDKSIRIWTLNTQKSIKSTNHAHQSINQPNFTFLSHLSYHQSAVNVVKFSPDGRLIASGDDHGSVAIWQRQGNEVIEVSETNPPIDQPMDESLDTPNEPATVDQLTNNLATQMSDENTNLSNSSDDPSDDSANSVSTPTPMCDSLMSEDKENSGQQANHAIADANIVNTPHKRIVPFTVIDEDSVQHIEPFNSPKLVTTAQPSNQSIINQSNDQTIKEVNPLSNSDDEIESLCSEKWVRVCCFKAHVDSIYALSWSPNGDSIATSCIDGQLSVWSIKGPRLIVSVPAHSGYIQGCVWDPLGQIIATVSNDRTCNLFHVQTSKVSLLTTFKNQKQVHVDDPNNPSTISSTNQPGDSEDIESPPSSQSTNPVVSHSLPLYIDDSLPSFFRRPSWSPDGRFLLTPAGLRIDDQRGGLPINRTTNPTIQQTMSQPTNPSTIESISLSGSQTNQMSEQLTDPSDKPLIKPKDEVFCTYLYNRDSLTEGPIASFSHCEPSIATSWSPHFFSTGQSTSSNLCTLPYVQLFAIATTRAVYVHSTHDAAPIAVVSSIHMDQLTDITWQHLITPSINQPIAQSINQYINRILVTSIDGYVSVIELDHLFERVSETEEISIRAEMLSRQPVIKISNKPKRKRLRKLKHSAESDEEPVANHIDSEEKPSADSESVTSRLLNDDQLKELQALMATSTRITVDLLRSKYSVSRVKASKMWREWKASQEQSTDTTSASKSSTKRSSNQSATKSAKSSKKILTADEETDSDDQSTVRSQFVQATPKNKAKVIAEHLTPAVEQTSSSDNAASSAQRKTVKRKAVDLLPVDTGMKKLDSFFVAGSEDSLEGCEVMAVEVASKPDAKSSAVKATPNKRARTNESKNSVKSTKSSKTDQTIEQSKPSKSQKSVESQKSTSESSKKAKQSKASTIPSTLAEPVTPSVNQTSDHLLANTTADSQTHAASEPPCVQPSSFQPIIIQTVHVQPMPPTVVSPVVISPIVSDNFVQPIAPVAPTVKKRLAPTLIDLLNAVPPNNPLTKRVTAPETGLQTPTRSYSNKSPVSVTPAVSVDHEPNVTQSDSSMISVE